MRTVCPAYGPMSTVCCSPASSVVRADAKIVCKIAPFVSVICSILPVERDEVEGAGPVPEALTDRTPAGTSELCFDQKELSPNRSFLFSAQKVCCCGFRPAQSGIQSPVSRQGIGNYGVVLVAVNDPAGEITQASNSPFWIDPTVTRGAAST